MYYIGLDVHKKTISYCVKDASGQVHQEGKVGATRRELDTPSQKQFATDGYYILSCADMEWFWGHYLASNADATNPYACPDRAKTLKGLPPATVITAEFDPLRDEGINFYRLVIRSGGAARCRQVMGTVHGTEIFPSVCPDISRDTARDIAYFAMDASGARPRA